MAAVIVTHAADAAARAESVAKRLAALGYEVRRDLDADTALSPHARRRLAKEIDAAACVLVLWSKSAPGTPALQAAAQRAKAAGKLILARSDAAPAPAAAIDLSNIMARDSRAWRALVSAISAKARPGAPSRRASPARRAAASTARPGIDWGQIAAGVVLALLVAAGLGAYHVVTTTGLPPVVAEALPPQVTALIARP